MSFGLLVARTPLPNTPPQTPVQSDRALPALRTVTAATLAHRWNEIVAVRVGTSRHLT